MAKKKEIVKKKAILVLLVKEYHSYRLTKKKYKEINATDKNFSVDGYQRVYYCRTDADYYIGGDYLFIVNLDKREEAFEAFKKEILKTLEGTKKDLESEIKYLKEGISDVESSMKQITMMDSIIIL